MLFWFFAKDRIAYAFCYLVGIAVSFSLRTTAWGPYVGMLFCFHLFLTYLVLTNENKSARSFNWTITIGCHLLFVLELVGFRYGMNTWMRNMIASQPQAQVAMITVMAARFTRSVMFLMLYGMTYLERFWLFDKNREGENVSSSAVPRFVSPAATKSAFLGPLAAATGEDHYEWIQQRSKDGATLYSAGASPADDFEQWLRARGKTQYPAKLTEPAGSSANVV